MSCGPPPLCNNTEKIWKGMGIQNEQIYRFWFVCLIQIVKFKYLRQFFNLSYYNRSKNQKRAYIINDWPSL
jgi:hypothetical protein